MQSYNPFRGLHLKKKKKNVEKNVRKSKDDAS